MRLPLIVLAAAPPGASEQSHQLHELTFEIGTNFTNAPCHLKRIPRMLDSLERARRSLQTAGVVPDAGLGGVISRCREN